MEKNHLQGIIGLTFRANTTISEATKPHTVEVLDKVQVVGYNGGAAPRDKYVVMITDTDGDLCGKVTTIDPQDLIELIKK